jgi:prepilin-type processing-associated H-X9-DG protein
VEEVHEDDWGDPPRRLIPSGRAIVFGVMTSLGIGIFVMLCLAVRDAGEAARRSQCVCNLCGVKLAFLNYHDTYGQFPPPFTTDANGRRLLSWRVLLLPYLEYKPLYDKFHLDEPWDNPHNQALLSSMPNIYHCPSHFASASLGYTNYAAITGPGTLFPFSGKVTFADITDGTHNTLAFAEVCDRRIPWTSPVDLDVQVMSFQINDPRRPGISSKHPGGANVVFADGTAVFLTQDTPTGKVRAMTTIAGGEPIDRD